MSAMNNRQLTLLSDEELSIFAQEGQNQAFNILLGRYRNYLLCIRTDPNIVEDILQDAFIKVFNNIGQLNGNDNTAHSTTIAF